MKTLQAYLSSHHFKTRLKELSLEIQDDIRLAMDGHEEIFDPTELCDVVEDNFNKFMNGTNNE